MGRVGNAPHTVEDEEPHGGTEGLAQKCVANRGKMRVEPRSSSCTLSARANMERTQNGPPAMVVGRESRFGTVCPRRGREIWLDHFPRLALTEAITLVLCNLLVALDHHLLLPLAPMEERSQSLKRKRESDYPRVTFTTGARTFDRLLKGSCAISLLQGHVLILNREHFGWAEGRCEEKTRLRVGRASAVRPAA